MKIGGIDVRGPSEQVLVLPRLDGNDIVIKARAVMDMDAFEALCPPPKPPGRRTSAGFKPNLKDKTYLQRTEAHGEQRFAYMVVMSLEPSCIEWDKVNASDPSTWRGWQEELKEAGLAGTEINRIVVCVMQANALDEEKLKAARENFLLGLEPEEDESSGPATEQETTQSGSPANDSG